MSGTLFLFFSECKCRVLFVGTLVLVEKDKILWSLQVDHRLFVLDKLDVTVSILSVWGFYGQARGHCGNRIKHVFNGCVFFLQEFYAVVIQLLLSIHDVVHNLYH